MSHDKLLIRDGSGTPTYIGTHTDIEGNKVPVHSLDSNVATYSYAIVGYDPVATPSVIAVIQGSADKVIRIRKVWATGVATAAGNIQFGIYRANDAGTPGSAILTAVTAAKHDTENADAEATVSTVGTDNYGTPPANDGTVRAGRLCLAADGTGAQIKPIYWNFGVFGEQALVLHGADERLCLTCFGDAKPTGALLDIVIETVEEDPE